MMLRVIGNFERWEWYAAGDKALARPAAIRPLDANAPERALWEIGLAVLVPLVLAVAASVALG